MGVFQLIQDFLPPESRSCMAVRTSALSNKILFVVVGGYLVQSVKFGLTPKLSGLIMGSSSGVVTFPASVK